MSQVRKFWVQSIFFHNCEVRENLTKELSENFFGDLIFKPNFQNCMTFYLRKFPLIKLFCISRTRNKNVQLTFDYSYTICKG